MSCRYCAQYIRLAMEKVDGFADACRWMRLDPEREGDWEAIVRGMAAVGQFGTSRLARSFPFITDEEQFRKTADVGLHFYWMLLDYWDEVRRREAGGRKVSENGNRGSGSVNR